MGRWAVSFSCPKTRGTLSPIVRAHSHSPSPRTMRACSIRTPATWPSAGQWCPGRGNTVGVRARDEDPLAEEHDSVVPGIVHRYPDRVLFLVTDFCSTYCRYCTRSRMVGRECRTGPERLSPMGTGLGVYPQQCVHTRRSALGEETPLDHVQ